jgi:hypothetical protein
VEIHDATVRNAQLDRLVAGLDLTVEQQDHSRQGDDPGTNARALGSERSGPETSELRMAVAMFARPAQIVRRAKAARASGGREEQHKRKEQPSMPTSDG